MSVPETIETRHWSTFEVPPPRRLDYFAAAISEAVMPISMDGADCGSFDAHVSCVKLADIGVTKVRGMAHTASRGPLEIARSGEHSFNLLMSLQTHWTAEHRGVVRMSPRDVLVIDSEYSLRTDVRSSYDAINVAVSERWLRRWVPDPRALTACRISGDSLWGLALSSYLAALKPELATSPPLPLAVMADQVGSLLALTVGSMQGYRSTTTKAERSLVNIIVECIRQRCTEPGLHATDVAASLDVSLRSLHRALASDGRTFGRELIDARAAVGLRMLRSPLFRRITIEQIGQRAGFTSASHFAQVVRARAGCSPRQVRRIATDPY